MTEGLLQQFNKVAEEVNKVMKHRLADHIREQDTYGVTKELAMFLSKYENQNIHKLTVLCNPSLTVFLESNNIYFKKLKEVIPFTIELKGDPNLQSRQNDDHYIFAPGSIDYKKDQ